MRNDKLKKDLNNIPQDFDQEQLWNSIELPQKKKKNRGFLWLLFLGISLSGILLFILANKDIKITIEDIKNDQISNQQPIQNASSKQSTSLQESKSAQINNHEDAASINEVVSNTQDDKIGELNNSKFVNSIPSKSISDPSNALNDVEVANVKVEVPNQVLYNEEIGLENIEKDLVVLGGNEKEINEINAEDDKSDHLKEEFVDIFEARTAQETQSMDSNPKGRELLLVQNLPIKQIFLDQFKYEFEGIDQQVSPLRKITVKKIIYGLSFNSFIGNDSHEFIAIEDLLNRKENEKALESFGLSFLGHLQFGEVAFFSGVSYVQYNTNLKFSTEDKSIINSLEGAAYKDLTTNYSLYNSYQFLDLVAGLGYKISINNKWSLIPSLQVAYSISRNLKGAAFSVDNYSEVYFVGNHYNSYSKWQGQGNLKIERKINDKLNLGITLYGNTQKTLGRSDSNTHKVESYGVGISVMSMIGKI